MGQRATDKAIWAGPAKGATARRPGTAGRTLVARTEATASLPEPIIEQAARRLRTLGHPTRLRLIGLLISGPRSVTDLASALELRRDAVSKHLGELLAVRAVRRAQEGNFALYALSDAMTPQLVVLACDAVQRDAARLSQLGTVALVEPDQG